MAVSRANTHNGQALPPLVGGAAPVRSRRGSRRRTPGKSYGDKGYDYVHLRRWLCKRGASTVRPVREWSPPNGRGDTGGRSSAPWPDRPDAAAYTGTVRLPEGSPESAGDSLDQVRVVAERVGGADAAALLEAATDAFDNGYRLTLVVAAVVLLASGVFGALHGRRRTP